MKGTARAKAIDVCRLSDEGLTGDVIAAGLGIELDILIGKVFH